MASKGRPGCQSLPETQSFPPDNPQSYQTHVAVPTTNRSRQSKVLKKFLTGEPKALGVTQILIGITSIATGIVLAQTEHDIVIHIGLPFWSGVLFITSGALTVTAVQCGTICVVNTSLAFNIVSSVVAGIDIILSSITLALSSGMYFYSRCFDSPSENTSCDYITDHRRMLSISLHVLLLLFTVLEMCIAIAGSAFGCRATCMCVGGYTDMPVIVVQYNANPGTNTITSVPSSNQEISSA